MNEIKTCDFRCIKDVVSNDGTRAFTAGQVYEAELHKYGNDLQGICFQTTAINDNNWSHVIFDSSCENKDGNPTIDWFNQHFTCDFFVG